MSIIPRLSENAVISETNMKPMIWRIVLGMLNDPHGMVGTIICSTCCVVKCQKEWWNTWETARNTKSIFILNTQPISKPTYVTSFFWRKTILLHFWISLWILFIVFLYAGIHQNNDNKKNVWLAYICALCIYTHKHTLISTSPHAAHVYREQFWKDDEIRLELD